MERWRKTWRVGFAPQLSVKQLSALAHALATDDPRLIQGATSTPPPLDGVQDWPVEAACAIGFCGWQGDGLTTVGKVDQFLAGCCYAAAVLMGEPAACRWFLNWFDETPRDEMRRLLLPEVRRELRRRRAAPDLPCPWCEGRGVTGRIAYREDGRTIPVDGCHLPVTEVWDGPCGTCGGKGMVSASRHAELTTAPVQEMYTELGGEG